MYIIYIYKVQNKLVKHIPSTPTHPYLPPNYSGKANKGKEKCDLFRECLYFKEVILNQIVKEAGK